MKEKTNVKGKIKVFWKIYWKGIITALIALVCIVLGIVFIFIPNGTIPAIILFCVGVGFAGASIGLTVRINSRKMLFPIWGYMSQREKTIREVGQKTESVASESEVLRAVINLSYGPLQVVKASVSEYYSNDFSIDLTIRITACKDDMLEKHIYALIDEAKRAVERLGISANICVGF